MNTAQVVPFEFEHHPVRVVIVDGDPWFVATDVCKAIGIINTTQALQALDDDERSMFKIGRQGNANIINESGMFTLILRCRDAVRPGTIPHKFRKWVAGEVLPTIRKTGRYIHPTSHANAHFHQQSLDRITITEEQHCAIAGFIDNISSGMIYKHSWHQGMWYALRQATGTRSPNRFLARDLPLIAHELQRVGEIARAFHLITCEASLRTVKEAIRDVGNEDAVLASIEREFAAIGDIPGQIPLGLLNDMRSTLGVV